MIDKFLNVGAAFDWITPGFAFLQDLIFGHPADFGIPISSYWGAYEIRELLHYYGIRVWGLMYNTSGEILMFTVNRRDAEATYYILREYDIAILYAPRIR